MLFNLRLRLSRWTLLLPIALVSVLVVGCVLYLTSTYYTLKAWYLGLYPCIYKHAIWSEKFFTPSVNESGRAYCMAGIVISTSLLAALIYTLWKRKDPFRVNISLQKADGPYLTGIYLFATIIWIYGFVRSYPAYDEVFSAVNCASIHPFQTASYYMLPNNHVFFNLLNSLLFHWAPNKVITGRLISATSIIILIPLLFYWLKSITGSRAYAAVFCAVMLLQFPVWAFAFQARGYAIYLLCAWTTLISLQKFIASGSGKHLFFHGLATVIAFITIPSYLFWELAIIVYALFFMAIKRKVYWSLIITHLISGCTVFLFFLPLLCFSGRAAITDNGYVKAAKIVSISEYWPGFRNEFESAIQYCFSGFVDAHNWSYRILFILPLLLLIFIRKSLAASTTAFYVIAWITLIAMTFKTQCFPFMRNFIAHDSLTLAAVLLSSFALMKIVLPQLILPQRLRIVKASIMGVAVLALSIHFVRFNRDHIDDSIYFYDVKIGYDVLQDALNAIPEGSRVGLSDEGFYWEFICHNRGLEASMCMGEAADYYVKQKNPEQVPGYLIGRVEKWREAEQYEILKVLPKSKDSLQTK